MKTTRKRAGGSRGARRGAAGAKGAGAGTGLVGREGITGAEFAARRERVLAELKGSVGLVLAGEGPEPHVGLWRADSFFAYLTGIDDEPGAAVLFDASAEDATRRITLFLRPLNPEADRWVNFRQPLGKSLRQRHGFGAVLRTGMLADSLLGAARRSKRLACLHPFGNHHSAVSADLALFRKVAERVPGVGIEDRTDILRAMRSCKSATELALMRRAVEITAAGFEAAARRLRPGAGERAVHHAIEDVYRGLGACGPDGSPSAYNAIVGSGARSTLLHYGRNDGPTEAGDLLVIDSGAQFCGYAADITRTYPVSGKFSTDQREVYELVLEAQKASINAARPGATMTDVNNATRAVFDKAGLLDCYWHGVGHHLGLEVHDTDAGTPLVAGHVVTIEPGLYMPERKIGVRIEDDILITRGGRENLSAMIPKTVKEVEGVMAG